MNTEFITDEVKAEITFNPKAVIELKETSALNYSIYIDGKPHGEKNLSTIVKSLLDHYTDKQLLQKIYDIYFKKGEKVNFTEELRNLLVSTFDSSLSLPSLFENGENEISKIENDEAKEIIQKELDKNVGFLAYGRILRKEAKKGETQGKTWERIMKKDFDNLKEISKNHKKLLKDEKFKDFHFLQEIDQKNISNEKAEEEGLKLVEALNNYYKLYDKSEDGFKEQIEEPNKLGDSGAIIIASNITNPIIGNKLGEFLGGQEKTILVKTKMKNGIESFIKNVLGKRNKISRKLKMIGNNPTYFELRKLVELELLQEIKDIWLAQEIAAYNTKSELCAEDASGEFIWDSPDQITDGTQFYSKKALKVFRDKDTKKFTDYFASLNGANIEEVGHLGRGTFDRTASNEISFHRHDRENPFKSLITLDLMQKIVSRNK